MRNAWTTLGDAPHGQATQIAALVIERRHARTPARRQLPQIDDKHGLEQAINLDVLHIRFPSRLLSSF